ncbi:hypothetical protein OF83DRAFT_1287643 [Amylostereum chailletii]|nr:hypothetical protein OF83DRAFT_1287643 [Amylostereum chailletii]
MQGSLRGTPKLEPEARAALKVFPKISGLAIKLSDNTVLRKTLETSNIYISEMQLGGIPSMDLKLGSFKLTGREKQLSEDLYDMLDSINQITLHFQGVDVPLIIDVIPAFERLQKDLERMSNAPELPAVCRVTAYGGLLMTCKYYQHFGDCEVYVIACVMCPDRKLEWFKKELSWSDDEVKDVRKVVEARFKQTYAQLSRAVSRPLPANEPQYLPAPQQARGANRWKSAAKTAATLPSDSDAGDIEVYLSTPPSVIDYASSATVLLYWDVRLKSQPALAHMGLSFTSSPATTIDAEHAFSEGRNQVNWNQEHTSSQTF